MNLEELGWARYADDSSNSHPPGEEVGRVAIEHRNLFVLYTQAGEVTAEVSGKLRHAAELGRPPGLPAVGDWVVIRPRPGENKATILQILPRRSRFVRKTAGRQVAEQVVAANMDLVFLVTALQTDLNVRRLERYLTLAWESGAQPVIVLNKADLCPDPAESLSHVRAIAPDVPLHLVSAYTGQGLAELATYFEDCRTVALLGSSGTGKSTLINRFLGQDVQRVQELRADGRGRHTTTHRELLFRSGGGLVIDTPGMRELQLWEGDDGVQTTFAEVENLASECRFTDCTHESEPGCAVRQAVEEGALPADRLESYRKLCREIQHQEARHDPRLREDRKRYEKLVHRAYYKRVKERGN